MHFILRYPTYLQVLQITLAHSHSCLGAAYPGVSTQTYTRGKHRFFYEAHRREILLRASVFHFCVFKDSKVKGKKLKMEY